VHSLHSEARRAEAKFGVVILCGNGRFWLGQSYHAKGCFQGNQHVTLLSIVPFRDFPSHRTVLPHCTVLIPCVIREKALKMAHFLNTASRNMAETCVIESSYPTSYSTSIPRSIGTLSALSNVSRAGLRKFRAKPTEFHFCVFFPIFDRPLKKKSKSCRKDF